VPRMSIRTAIERGPKEKKVAAVAIDWPGWSRGAKTADKALESAWRFFDEVVARVSAQMRKGPRGGGPDRDPIIGHVLVNEGEDFSRRIGVPTPREVMLTPDGLRAHRATYLAAFRERNQRDWEVGRNWTLPFLLRHTAYHVLDHAWEMEDKDLS
jgi:hypothetical protein